MPEDRSCVLRFLVWSTWLATFQFVASAATMPDLEPPGLSYQPLRRAGRRAGVLMDETVKRSTSEELLTEASEALQKKIDKVDEALVEFQQQRAASTEIGQPSLRAAGKPSIMKQDELTGSSKGEARGEVASGRLPSLVQSDANARTGSHGFWGDLVEWQYVDSHTLPRRNKIVLAIIELIFPLAWFGLDRLYLGQPVMAGLKMLCTSLGICGLAMQPILFCTCTLLALIWAFLDALVIAQNCVLGSKYLHQFGLGAWFGDELEINIAKAIGVVIVLVWMSAHTLLCCFAYQRVRWDQNFEYLIQRAPTHHGAVNLAMDPWLSSINSKGNKNLNVSQDPFAIGGARGGPYNDASLPPAGNSAMYQTQKRQPYQGKQPYQDQRRGCEIM